MTNAVGAGEKLARLAALAAAVMDAYPGLIDAQLAKASDQARGWCEARGVPRQRAGGRCGRARYTLAKAAFALTKCITTEYAVAVDA